MAETLNIKEMRLAHLSLPCPSSANSSGSSLVRLLSHRQGKADQGALPGAQSWTVQSFAPTSWHQRLLRQALKVQSKQTNCSRNR